MSLDSSSRPGQSLLLSDQNLGSLKITGDILLCMSEISHALCNVRRHTTSCNKSKEFLTAHHFNIIDTRLILKTVSFYDNFDTFFVLFG